MRLERFVSQIHRVLLRRRCIFDLRELDAEKCAATHHLFDIEGVCLPVGCGEAEFPAEVEEHSVAFAILRRFNVLDEISGFA